MAQQVIQIGISPQEGPDKFEVIISCFEKLNKENDLREFYKLIKAIESSNNSFLSGIKSTFILTFLRALKNKLKDYKDKSPMEYQQISALSNFDGFVQLFDSWRNVPVDNKSEKLRFEFHQDFFDFVSDYNFILNAGEDEMHEELRKVVSARSWEAKTGFVKSLFELIRNNVSMADIMGIVKNGFKIDPSEFVRQKAIASIGEAQ